ncbi:DUF4157 domain-containing protein [Deinococcus sp. HMF7620]|uniref:DUF4157 domain-containing protein n=1 Tax=Deinococcus arboris TaxID=2682977 RepID=A0A7C9HRU4_9DEIO|nr:DUF4157 domain-containing protein [Deinococcus arboris]MVN87007.1 DUF4157 domain-containing protein [Deinococcus arboris]
MNFESKPLRRTKAGRPHKSSSLSPQVDAPSPALPSFLFRPLSLQRQVVQPVLAASALLQADTQARALQRQRLMTQSQEDVAHPVPSTLAPVPTAPRSPADWVTVMRHQAQQTEGKALSPREWTAWTALQRQVATHLSQGYRRESGPAQVRQERLAAHLAHLQDHPLSAPVAGATLALVPPGERPALQRALDAALAREQTARAQLAQQTLQRQLAELDAQEAQPALERIQARRGAGRPLPGAVQRHLEQGLNHDLSRVRVHADAEAHTLAKGVNAVAFTSGTDIYFQAGRYDPNTQTGLELLAHEATHAVQQMRGQVGPGVDPDAGLEVQAQNMGRQIAALPRQAVRRATPPLSFGHMSPGQALQRLAAPTASRRWEQPHAFEGQLASPTGSSELSITALQVIGKGVIVGQFTATNGTGRIDGFLDSKGNVYWTARYQTGVLKDKARKFHGRIEQNEKGVPTRVLGTWLGQNAQGKPVAYRLKAEHQESETVPEAEADSAGGGPGLDQGIHAVPASLKLPDGTTLKLDPKDFSAQGSFATTTATTGQTRFAPQPTGLAGAVTRQMLADVKGLKPAEVQTARPWTGTEFFGQGPDYQDKNGPLKYASGLHQVHSGWDLNTTMENVPGGSMAKAAADGIVWYKGWTGMGNTIVLYHPQFKRHTRYGHLKDLGTLKVGQIVKAGAEMAVLGNTNTGLPHLHFDVIKEYVNAAMWNGTPVGKTQEEINKFVKQHYEDPMLFFARAGVRVPGTTPELMAKETKAALGGGGFQGQLAGLIDQFVQMPMLSPNQLSVQRQAEVPALLRKHLELIFNDCLRAKIDNPNQVAYVLATAYHETGFGIPKFTRSATLQEDANPLKQDAQGSYRVNHVTGRRVPGASLVAYFNEAYGRNTGLGNRAGTDDGYNYRGQGFVQLTGRSNYGTMSALLNKIGFSYSFAGKKYGKGGVPIDLLTQHEHVSQVPELASVILVQGMKAGSFRSKKNAAGQRILQSLDMYFNVQGNDFTGARNMINGDGLQNGAKVAAEAQAFLQTLLKNQNWKNLSTAYKAAGNA